MYTKIFSMLLIIFLLLTGCTPASNAPQPASPVSTAVATTEPSGEPSTAPTVATTPRVVSTPTAGSTASLTYPIVDTGQGKCYDNSAEIPCPSTGEPFYGQDAQYTRNTPRYQDNGDGTVTDLITGLMWQQDPGEKMTYAQAVAGTSSFNLAGYNDWRLPTIKELYSLILFDGTDVSACPSGTCSATPFVDTRYFKFQYGDTDIGERVIDSQFATSTKYVSTTMNGDETVFGVNFADGRIKGYPTGPMPGKSEGKRFYVLYVRGNPVYGQNSFMDNGNGTITDNVAGLTWMQSDSGAGMNWSDALAYCEGSSAAGYDDWRLPNAKELQSIVDYSRSPATTNSAAIDPIFSVTAITDEAEKMDYPFYWSSTTHADSSGHGANAAYVAFGEALGYMKNTWEDVHGAGAQRSDPKTGSAADYPTGHGPQGDAIRIENYVRCVRGGKITSTPDGDPNTTRPTMTVQSTGIQQNQSGGTTGQGGQNGQSEACRSDLTKAAAALNITVEQLLSALGEPSQGQPDINAISSKLGVTADALQQAMQQVTPSNCPAPSGGQPASGQPAQGGQGNGQQPAGGPPSP